MKKSNPQYRPMDQRFDPKNLVCPNCGNDVPEESYDSLTELIRCPECEHIFALLEESQDNTLPTSDNQNPHSPRPRSFFVIATLLLIIALIALFFIKKV